MPEPDEPVPLDELGADGLALDEPAAGWVVDCLLDDDGALFFFVDGVVVVGVVVVGVVEGLVWATYAMVWVVDALAVGAVVVLDDEDTLESVSSADCRSACAWATATFALLGSIVARSSPLTTYSPSWT